MNDDDDDDEHTYLKGRFAFDRETRRLEEEGQKSFSIALSIVAIVAVIFIYYAFR